MHGNSRRYGSSLDPVQLMFAALKASKRLRFGHAVSRGKYLRERVARWRTASLGKLGTLTQETKGGGRGPEKTKAVASMSHLESRTSPQLPRSAIYLTYAFNLCLGFDVMAKGPSFAKAAGRRSWRVGTAIMLLLAGFGMLGTRPSHAKPSLGDGRWRMSRSMSYAWLLRPTDLLRKQKTPRLETQSFHETGSELFILLLPSVR